MAAMARALVALGLLELTAGEDPCVKVNTSYYDDSKPPVAVKYMANAIACQAACESNAPCEAWTFLRDAGSCWQLPASQQMILVGNPHGESGLKLWPHGRTASKSVWTSASLAAAPAEAPAAVPPHILGAEPPLAEGGPVRPACASRGKALNDPMVQILNGGYVALATDCQSRCASAPLCVFWTFYNDTGGCWLQGSNVTSFLNRSAISGPKLCDAAVEASPYAAGHNISGNAGAAQTVLMRSIPRPECSFRGKAYRDPEVKAPTGYVDTAEMCQDSCSRSLPCARFTYYIDSKACWLQGSNATEFPSAMAIAGPKACDEPHPVSLKEMQLDTVLNCAKSKVAREGDELLVPEVMVKSDAVECQASCKDTSECEYFTFYPASHRCTLHGKDASTIISLDSISGPKACDDPVLPVGAWEVKLTRMASGWRSHAGPFMLVVVAASCLALTVVVCGRMSQVFARWGNSYRHVASRANPRLDEDMEERFVEAA